jgi:hypothetical protein
VNQEQAKALEIQRRIAEQLGQAVIQAISAQVAVEALAEQNRALTEQVKASTPMAAE